MKNGSRQRQGPPSIGLFWNSVLLCVFFFLFFPLRSLGFPCLYWLGMFDACSPSSVMGMSRQADSFRTSLAGVHKDCASWPLKLRQFHPREGVCMCMCVCDHAARPFPARRSSSSSTAAGLSSGPFSALTHSQYPYPTGRLPACLCNEAGPNRHTCSGHADHFAPSRDTRTRRRQTLRRHDIRGTFAHLLPCIKCLVFVPLPPLSHSPPSSPAIPASAPAPEPPNRRKHLSLHRRTFSPILGSSTYPSSSQSQISVTAT